MKKVSEEAKIAIQKERIRNLRYSLSGIYHSLDTIVQLSKHKETTIKEMTDIARVARSQTYLLGKQMELENRRIKEMRYGKLIESDIEIPMIEKNEDD